MAIGRELREKYPPERTGNLPLAQALRAGGALLFSEVDDAVLESAAVDAEHLRLSGRWAPAPRSWCRCSRAGCPWAA